MNTVMMLAELPAHDHFPIVESLWR